MECARCGMPVLVGGETVSCHCWRCTMFVPDPKQGPRPSLEIPQVKEIRECCNYVSGQCVIRGPGPCIVLEGWRCGWWEKAVAPTYKPSGRNCAVCGESVPRRRRLCDSCRRASARNTKREWKRRKESAVDSYGLQPAHTDKNLQPCGGVSETNDRP